MIVEVSRGSLQKQLSQILGQLKKDPNISYQRRLSQYFSLLKDPEPVLATLQKMICSADSADKLAGLNGLQDICKNIKENMQSNIVNRFQSIVFKQFDNCQDESVLQKSADLFKLMLKLGGRRINNVVENYLNTALQWLKNPNSNDNKKRGSFLILQNLLAQSPYITFKNIFTRDSSMKGNIIWCHLRSKNQSLRNASLCFFEDCIKHICQRQDSFQQKHLHVFFKDIKSHFEVKDMEHIIHGNIEQLRILLTYANAGVFKKQDLEQSIRYTRARKNTKSHLILRAVVRIVPILGKVAGQLLRQQSLKQAMDTLMKIGYQVLKRNQTKGQAYDSIAELILVISKDQDWIMQQIWKLIDLVILELKDTASLKLMSMISCLHKIINKFRDRIASREGAREVLEQLVDYLLINGLNDKTVQLLSGICNLGIQELSNSVQLKLLHIVGLILLNKVVVSNYDDKSIYMQQFKSRTLGIPLGKNEDKANVIRCLSMFKFKSRSYNISQIMAVFVKNYVLQFLDDRDKDVRSAAATAAFMLYVRRGRVGASQMAEILKKLIDLGMREFGQLGQVIFKQLEQNGDSFDTYLNTQQNLQKLFICVSQPNKQVQKCVMKILCRLSTLSPGVILPKLKMTLFHVVEQLSITDCKSLDPNQIQLLRTLILHSQQVVLPHLSSICQLIVNHLAKDQGVNSPFLFRTFSAVCEQSFSKALPHIHLMMQYILSSMQDKSDTRRRQTALQCFISIVRHTGYVVIPYYIHSEIINILLNMLRLQQSSDIRIKVLQLMGGLGAVEFSGLRYFQSQLNFGKSKQDALRSLLKKQFAFFAKKDLAIRLQTQRNPIKQLHSYYQDLILLDTNAFTTRQIKQAKKLQVAENQLGIDPLLNFVQENAIPRGDNITPFCLKLIIKIIEDQSLYKHHYLALQTISSIVVSVLKKNAVNYVSIIIPQLLNLIHRPNLKQNLLKLIQKLVRNCQAQLPREYIHLIVSKIMAYAEKAHTNICFQILQALTVFCKPSLKHLMQPIIKTSNKVLQTTQNKNLITKIFTIFSQFQGFMNPYLHMVIPPLSKMLLLNKVNIHDIQLVKQFSRLLINFAVTCSSTIQYLSLIAKSIFKGLEWINEMQKTVQTMVAFNSLLDCVVAFLVIYKENFIVYLPLINKLAQRVHHNNYKKCLNYLLSFHNLHDIDTVLGQNDFLLLQPNLITQPPEVQPSVIERRLQNPQRLVSQFTSDKQIFYEDWSQWLRKTSQELLRQSPNPILKICCALGQEYQQFATNLYNVAFNQTWIFLNDQHKRLIVKQLTRIIQNPACQTIHQDILNLAEFMLHEREGLEISFQALGKLAERTQAYAKALYYRERQYQKCPQRNIQSLLIICTQMGLNDSAQGLSIINKRKPQTRLYQKLQHWEKALDDYRNLQNRSPQTSFFMPKIRCLNAIGEWQQVIRLCDNQKDQSVRKQIASLACNAAMNLRKWDTIKQYQTFIQPSDKDKKFFESAVAILQKRYQDAKELLQVCRRQMQVQVSQLLLQSFGRAFDSLLRLQQLFQMQEIIQIKIFEDKVHKVKEGRYLQKKDLLTKLIEKKNTLKEIWKDRLNGCPRDLQVWQKILAVRGLLFSKNQDLVSWLKFCKLAIKSSKFGLAIHSISLIKQQAQTIHPNVFFTEMESLFREGKIRQNQLLQKATEYLIQNDSKLENSVKAKYYHKLANWLQSKADNVEINSKIISLYDKSIKFQPNYIKAWHYYALFNFQSLSAKNSSKTNNQFALASVRGFIKSIGLGSHSQTMGKFCMQDSLRLLNLVFTYGENQQISKQFRQSFKVISTQIWIFVLPQIIARMSSTSLHLQRLLHDLLVHISLHHPQALIYPLTVACKSKSQVIRRQALQIVTQMRVKNAVLVEQALLIAEDLNHAAIKLNQLWNDGIHEAIRGIFIHRRFEHMFEILTGLHEETKLRSQSNSDRAFKQEFGGLIRQAQAWLNKCKVSRDQFTICQTIGKHYNLYDKTIQRLKSLKYVYLENVSPRLLTKRNCQISVPGLYKPNRPLIRVSHFNHKLPVLLSKQRPRKLTIVGSDGKQYLFLLKGREDLRQDQRVMQLFSLVNKLLANDPQTQRKQLNITKYSVVPLSTNTGLIGWVRDCDTILMLIKQYREQHLIKEKIELQLVNQFCKEHYPKLSLLNKIQIFRHVLDNTRGQDICKVLWLKSPNSQTWVQRRTMYTRSMATMSMVGYILGLGDRHPSNIMMKRDSGKIVHIDFGDCFEVAMKRQELPQKVPFRLTRMFVNAMQVAALEGGFRITAQSVMKVLRNNRQSLTAMLQAFVYDPLINQRLLIEKEERPAMTINFEKGPGSLIMSHIEQAFIDNQNVAINQGQKKRKTENKDKDKPLQKLNKKAIEVTERIKKKLTGRDFEQSQTLSVQEQVSKLIEEATSHQNICQSYLGWCPFW